MEEHEKENTRQALLRQDITWQQALEMITDSNKNTWQTPQQERQRQSLIKDRCEQCGSSDGPMVLLQLKQPRSFRDLYALVRQSLFKQYRQEHPLVVDEPEPVEIAACPRCSSTRLYRYRSADDPYRWVCLEKSGRSVCGYQFDEPVMVRLRSPEQKQMYSRLCKVAYEQRRAEFRQLYHDQIATQAVLLLIEEHLLYMNFGDAAILCEPCAFLWNTKQLRLCNQCKKDYHSLYQSCCDECSNRRQNEQGAIAENGQDG